LGKWLVKFRYRGRDLNLGHYDEPEPAARAADYAKYMVLGLKSAYWHHNVGKPNFLPSTNVSYSRLAVIDKLIRLHVVGGETLQARMAEYDAAADENAALRAYLRPSPAT
jgi:hypothetical protein